MTNIKNSELENEQLVSLKGGYELCQKVCSGAANYVSTYITKYHP
ncbi:hypothetical protein [Draconibacterium orientale]